MSDRRTDHSREDLKGGALIAAAVLCAIGSILGLVGFTLTVGTVVGAWRRWYHRVDLPAHQLARLKWEQAKAASRASVGAWRDTEEEKYSPRPARTR